MYLLRTKDAEKRRSQGGLFHRGATTCLFPFDETDNSDHPHFRFLRGLNRGDERHA